MNTQAFTNEQTEAIREIVREIISEPREGPTAMQKATAQLRVIDAHRLEKLASQQAKLLTESERAKGAIPRTPMLNAGQLDRLLDQQAALLRLIESCRQQSPAPDATAPRSAE